MNNLHRPQNLDELMRRQWRGLAGGLQVIQTKRFGRASATVCHCQSILSCKYRKIWKIVYSLTPFKRPPSGRLKEVGRSIEIKTPETVLMGTLIAGRLIEVAA